MPRYHISDDRKRDIVLLHRTHSARQISGMLDVSERTVQRVIANVRQTGRVSRPAPIKGRHRILTNNDVTFLQSCVERTPDIYLRELQQELEAVCGAVASEATIERALKRRGYSRKKVTRAAVEASAEAQSRYMRIVSSIYREDQFVFVDESACNRFTTQRPMAWAPIGERARRHDYFIRGKRYSILPALSLDGLLHLHIQDHSYTGDEFLHFVDALLNHMNPWPMPNSVVVMDNASIHKSAELKNMVEDRGMHILYLPSYSPHFNPIEEGFSAMKSWIRANRSYALDALADGDPAADPLVMLTQAVGSAMTAENAFGWFRHAGYIEDDNV